MTVDVLVIGAARVAYPEEEFWQDLRKVTGGATHEKLARLVIRASSRRTPPCSEVNLGLLFADD